VLLLAISSKNIHITVCMLADCMTTTGNHPGEISFYLLSSHVVFHKKRALRMTDFDYSTRKIYKLRVV